MPSTATERLLAKIRAAGVPLPPRVTFARTYAGVWQRRQGSWVWFLVDADIQRPLDVGSQYPQRKLTGRITVSRNDHGEYSVDPVPSATPTGTVNRTFVHDDKGWHWVCRYAHPDVLNGEPVDTFDEATAAWEAHKLTHPLSNAQILRAMHAAPRPRRKEKADPPEYPLPPTSTCDSMVLHPERE